MGGAGLPLGGMVWVTPCNIREKEEIVVYAVSVLSGGSGKWVAWLARPDGRPDPECRLGSGHTHAPWEEKPIVITRQLLRQAQTGQNLDPGYNLGGGSVLQVNLDLPEDWVSEQRVLTRGRAAMVYHRRNCSSRGGFATRQGTCSDCGEDLLH